ncbi:MAG TPA: hypothetical protein VFF69_11910 [Phycisphaerales bacterium]|nr:hypothetical protein [Phycisphaerales bacterium]
MRNLGASGAVGTASLFAASALLGGCASSVDGPREFSVAPGSYESAFEATGEALRGLQFELERIDAASGVITTKRHFAPGLLEPWDPSQSGPGDEWEDALNMQAREVRVTFTPVAAPAPDPGDAAAAPATDLRTAEGEIVGSVWVTVYRQQRAGRRLESEWIGGSTVYSDPDLNARAGARYMVPLRRDERLESRLAARIRETIETHPGEDAGQKSP